MMKKYKNIIAFCLLCMLTMTACGDKDDSFSRTITPEATGTYLDARDNKTYHWVRIGGLEWMIENLCYDLDDETNCTYYLDYNDSQNYSMEDKWSDKYGFLYTHAGAMKAVPEGWRVPSDEDWKLLEQTLGLTSKEADTYGWRGNLVGTLMRQTSEGTMLNMLLAGYYTSNTVMMTPGYRFMGVYGYYWTSTKDETKDGEYYFYRKLYANYPSVYRESMDPIANKLSVRLVRDITE